MCRIRDKDELIVVTCWCGSDDLILLTIGTTLQCDDGEGIHSGGMIAVPPFHYAVTRSEREWNVTRIGIRGIGMMRVPHSKCCDNFFALNRLRIVRPVEQSRCVHAAYSADPVLATEERQVRDMGEHQPSR